MTEDEANTKWCPHARIASEMGAFNAEYLGGRLQSSSFCIASACMAWRWLDTHIKNPDHPSEALMRSTRTHGACGLAGPWFQNYSKGASEVFELAVYK